MSSFVSGSNPTSSTICFIRRTIESPIRAWDWMMTKFKAVNRMRGVLIGGFFWRFNLCFMGDAGDLDIAGGRASDSLHNVMVSLQLHSPHTPYVCRCTN